MKKALKLTGIKKKVDIVNLAMRKLVEQKEIEKIFELRGKIKWEGIQMVGFVWTGRSGL